MINATIFRIKNMKKIYLLLVISVALVGLFIYWIFNSHQKNSPAPEITKKITVTTTLFPLYDMARAIGQDKVDVSLLLPPGIEAHSFDPKPTDIVRIHQSDLFIFTGKFMEPWAEEIVHSTPSASLRVVDASANIKLLSLDQNHEKNHHHNHQGIDPHIWLDLANAQIMVDNITQALIAADPTHTNFYQHNAKNYKKELALLDYDYQTVLSQCKQRKLVYGGHYAFGYLSQRYHLEYSSAYGLSPNSEPSARELIAIIENIKKNSIHHLFFEEMLSPKVAETLAHETGTQLLVLNPAHNVTAEEFQKGLSFVDIMKNNLINLSLGLDCQK
jgi:zinc transport system substrate-binding protein